MPSRLFAQALLNALIALLGIAAAGTPPKPPTLADVLAHSQPGDWRPLDPENTIYLELPNGRVVIELAPDFAPMQIFAPVRLASSR